MNQQTSHKTPRTEKGIHIRSGLLICSKIEISVVYTDANAVDMRYD